MKTPKLVRREPPQTTEPEHPELVLPEEDVPEELLPYSMTIDGFYQEVKRAPADKPLRRRNLIFLVKSFEDAQHTRVMAMNRLRAMGRSEDQLKDDLKSYAGPELILKRTIEKLLRFEPIYQEHLSKITGVGASYAGKLIAYIGDIERFPNASKLTTYAGLNVITRCGKCKKRIFLNNDGQVSPFETNKWVEHIMGRLKMQADKRLDKVAFNEAEALEDLQTHICKCPNPEVIRVAPKRKRGELVEWNPDFRSLLWNIGKQFVKQGKAYRTLYDGIKAEQTERDGATLSKGQIDARARRKVMKVFLNQLWEQWRLIEGLPAPNLWVLEHGGHTDKLPLLRDESV
jgi:hypothetical protein